MFVRLLFPFGAMETEVGMATPLGIDTRAHVLHTRSNGGATLIVDRPVKLGGKLSFV